LIHTVEYNVPVAIPKKATAKTSMKATVPKKTKGEEREDDWEGPTTTPKRVATKKERDPNSPKKPMTGIPFFTLY
jgi:hypothetical protein